MSFPAIAAAQYNYYYAGLIPSTFYGSLTAHKLDDFKTSLYQSVIVLISACVVIIFNILNNPTIQPLSLYLLLCSLV